MATAIASAGEKSSWYLFYTFPVGICVVNLAFVCFAFRDSLVVRRETPAERSNAEREDAERSDAEGSNREGDNDEQMGNSTDGGASRGKNAVGLIVSTLERPSVWLLSGFYFFYIGSQITSNGWVVEYLVQVRGGDLSSMGYVPAGFNGGCLLGRLLLAEPTHRLGERRMVFLYCCLALGLQLIFWL